MLLPSTCHVGGLPLTSTTGNIKSLNNQHTYHVTAARPELAKFMALPPGFRFRVLAEEDDVWFDPKVAAERA